MHVKKEEDDLGRGKRTTRKLRLIVLVALNIDGQYVEAGTYRLL